MGELKVNFVVENLNKVKKSLENIKIGGLGLGTTTGGKDKTGTNKTLVGGFAFLGGLLGGIVSQLDVVKGLLGVLNGLFNSLVAPFVPLLLGLIKPVFILLQVFLKKVLQTLGLTPNEDGGTTSALGTTIASIGAILAGILVGLAIPAEAFIVGIAAALGAIVAAILIGSFKIGDSIGNFVKTIPDLFKKGLDNVAFTGKFIFNKIQDWVFKGLENVAFTGKFIFDKIKEVFFSGLKGISKVFDVVGNFLLDVLVSSYKGIKNIFVGFFKLLKSGLEFILNGVKSIAVGFINLFRKGLNIIIGLLNKVGLSVPKIQGGSSAGNVSTEININIEGSADQKTVEEVTNRLRQQLARRGAI